MVNDFIAGVAVAFDPVFTIENQNVGTIRSRGVELIGTVGPFWDMSLSAGYTYTDAEVTECRADPTLEGNRVEGAPVHIVTFSASYHRPRGLQVTFRGRYLSEQFQDTSNETRLMVGGLCTAQIPATNAARWAHPLHGGFSSRTSF